MASDSGAYTALAVVVSMFVGNGDDRGMKQKRAVVAIKLSRSLVTTIAGREDRRQRQKVADVNLEREKAC